MIDRIIYAVAIILIIAGASEVMAEKCYTDSQGFTHCSSPVGKVIINSDSQGNTYIREKDKTTIIRKDSQGFIHSEEIKDERD